ncbi:TetR/AcrR family transcriptional regulator [Rhizobium sp. YIM 134829]|uniref:TetR/AcrR family transcriptional regulator n=1 Tax=Rhizobium sp. YIM 134829 TaxID=3390453 RepID=UPI00397D23F1
MSERVRRTKDPDGVRRHVLAAAADLVQEQGIAPLTLEAVARRAGVSKGGLLHHFPAKAALVESLLDDLLTRLDAVIDAAMAEDSEPQGRFSRAYLAAIAMLDAQGPEVPSGWSSVCAALVADPSLRARWQAWVEARQAAHAETDSSANCRLVRLAADGLWLADVSGGPHFTLKDRHALLVRLQALTRS